MAEAAVSLVIERIADSLIKEPDYLRGARDEITRLQEELKKIQYFLKDADRMQYQDERVRNWIAQVRDAVYDAEDVIDSFFSEAQTGRGLIKRFTGGYYLHKIQNQIESIRKRIRYISASMQTYGIKFVNSKEGSSSNSEIQQRLRRSNLGEVVIGFDSVIRDLKTQLMAEEDRLRVVSVCGMGGLGKTTLARIVYNNNDVKMHFDCCAWACVSEEFGVRDILITILMDVVSSGRENYLAAEEKELARELNEKLTEKRYLVVLDDIWSSEAWDCLKDAFPNGKKGSKILFTTRNGNVALYADPRSSPVYPPHLTHDQSWELLSSKALLNDNIAAYGDATEFQNLGREMLRKCVGLPLAICVLGGLLATKHSLNEWIHINQQFKTQFSDLGGFKILDLSYDHLPFHLKPCFLYLSLFPENWEFHKKLLIRMWIAEGFIGQPSKSDGDVTMEDVAEQYLEELVSRSLVQVSERDHTGFGVKTFCLHDLMRDLCLSKAINENFAAVINHFRSGSMSRRLSVHSLISGDDDGDSYAALVRYGDRNLRSLVYFVGRDAYQMSRSHEVQIYKKFRLLRVLNLRGIRLHNNHMHRAVGNLVNLRYLGLRDTGLSKGKKSYFCSITSLPASISNLNNLYTLDIRGNDSVSLPDVLWKLQNLRHLLLNFRYFGSIQLGGLENLETLKWIRAGDLIRKDAMFKLPYLRNLALVFHHIKEAEIVLKSSVRLRSLKMMMLKFPIPSLEPLSNSYQLTKLELQGEISEVPNSIHHNLQFLPNSLFELVLECSKLKQDPMGILEKLPKLRILSLGRESFIGSKMVCSVNGFPQLEILILKKLDKVEEWEIEEGAMPCLKTLCMDHLSSLKMIPEGLKFLTTLQELKLTHLSEVLKMRVKEEGEIGGEDFRWTCRHIPSILIT